MEVTTFRLEPLKPKVITFPIPIHIITEIRKLLSWNLFIISLILSPLSIHVSICKCKCHSMYNIITPHIRHAIFR